LNELKIKFLYAGLYDSPKPWKSHEHSHSFFELIGVVEGQAEIVCKGVGNVVRAPAIVLYEPGAIHMEASNDSTAFKFSYSGFLACSGSKRLKDPMKGSLRAITKPGDAKIALSLMGEIIREAKIQAVGWDNVVKGNISKIARMLSAETPREKEIESPQAMSGGILRRKRIVEKVKAYIDSRASSKISIGELTKIVYLSPFYLGRIFKDETGLSPIQYSISNKIASAKSLLANSDMSVSEIAAELGYDSIHYFSKMFSKVVGVSPRAYRSSPAGTASLK